MKEKDLGGSASKPPQGTLSLDPLAAKLRFAERVSGERFRRMEMRRQ